MTCRTLISIVCSFVALGPIRADDPSPETKPVKHRVTGLFSPDRVADLQLVFKEKIPEIQLVNVDYQHAEATFVYDADKLFNRPNPEQLIERFDNLLRGQTAGTFGIRAVCSIPREKLDYVEVPVVGLDCKGCSLAAYEAVFRLEGVEQATASFRDGLVTAWIDPEKTERSKLETALKQRNIQLSMSSMSQ